MLNMLTFWLAYGLLTIIWWGFIVYWSFPLMDKIISRWTNGDYPSLLSDKFRNPFMMKLGLMDVVDPLGRKNSHLDKKLRIMFDMGWDSARNRWNAVIVSWFAVGGFIVNILTVFKCDESLHTVTINIANYLVEYASTPILIVVAFFLLDGVIRKFYTIGKKAKTLLDKLPDENNPPEEKNQVDNKD